MKRVIVMHGSYGCDTGCCGHWIKIEDSDEKYVNNQYTFDHPGKDENFLEYAKRAISSELGPDHVKDLDWDNCVVISEEECGW